MNVQVVFTSSYPKGQVSSNRVHYLCKGLAENGANVELLIAHPTETPGKIHNEQVEGIHENVRFRYAGYKVIRSKYLIVRKLVDIYCHFLTIIQLLLNNGDFDVFIVIGISFDFRLLLPVVVMFNNAKIMLEINEYPFVTKKNHFVTKIKRSFIFKVIFPLFDGFIVISTALNNLVNHYKSRMAHSIIVPVLVDNLGINDCSRPPIKSPYIIHTGSIYESKDGIIGVLQAFKIAVTQLEQPIRFVITGEVRNNQEYKQLIVFLSENQLSDLLIFTGYLNKKELECYLHNSSLAIINKHNNMQNRYCFPTKLADYLKYEVPVIVTSVGESNIYLKDGINAHVIEPEDINILASKIIQVFKNPEQSKSIAKNGKSLVEKEFNYYYQGQKLVQLLKSVCEPSV